MTDELDAFLDRAFQAQERLSSGELQRRSLAADLPATLLTRIDALPDGEYAQDEAAEALRTLGPEPIGDGSRDDFAAEHQDTRVDPNGPDDPEPESPRGWDGLGREGPP